MKASIKKIIEIQSNFPKLTFQNEGYQYLSKEIKESDEYASFKKDLLEKLKSEIADGSVRKKKKNGTEESTVRLGT